MIRVWLKNVIEEAYDIGLDAEHLENDEIDNRLNILLNSENSIFKKEICSAILAALPKKKEHFALLKKMGIAGILEEARTPQDWRHDMNCRIKYPILARE
jgi:hypothetical protein